MEGFPSIWSIGCCLGWIELKHNTIFTSFLEWHRVRKPERQPWRWAEEASHKPLTGLSQAPHSNAAHRAATTPRGLSVSAHQALGLQEALAATRAMVSLQVRAAGFVIVSGHDKW